MENNWYVYVHEVNGICFYVGIGSTEKRWRSRGSRNRYWLNVVNQNDGVFNAHKILEGLTKEEACAKEIRYIELFKLHKAARTNLSSGGEGCSGWVPSAETRKKMSLAHKGKVSPNKGKRFSEEYRAKLSDSKKGKTPSEETRKKMSEANSGKRRSEETCKKISESKKGRSGWNKGKSHSDETRAKISEAKKGKQVGNQHAKGKARSAEHMRKMAEGRAAAKLRREAATEAL